MCHKNLEVKLARSKRKTKSYPKDLINISNKKITNIKTKFVLHFTIQLVLNSYPSIIVYVCGNKISHYLMMILLPNTFQKYHIKNKIFL